jgi:pyruvate dehydrogenase E2 component (dihydrolipoamide acetyltransferase)
MAHVLVMPKQGNTVESCVLVSWKVAEGATVTAEQVVCEVETDKATFEVPAGEAGIVLKLLRAAGDDVPVMEPIAVIGQRGEDWSAAAGAAPAAAAAPDPAAAPPQPPAAAPVQSAPADAGPQRGISPRARRLAREAAFSTAGLAGTGPGGRVIERDVRAGLEARPPLTAAARAAVTAGAQVPAAGTALGGRVGLSDLGAGGGTAPRSAPTGAGAAGEGAFTETPVKSIRKIIAERMRASLSSTAQLTFNGSAPAARISALRARFKAADPALGLSEITIGDLVTYVVSRVVPRFPVLNSHLSGGTLRTFERVHLGFAVDTPRGLLVPVLRNVDQLSLAAISAESKRLAAACQNGTVKPDELTGATFTVTNLGAFGIESFTPVLNAPEVGILGVCAIVPRPVAGKDGAVTVEQRMGLSLTVDHQIIDGAPAARILKAFCDAIGEIDLLWTR